MRINDKTSSKMEIRFVGRMEPCLSILVVNNASYLRKVNFGYAQIRLFETI